ncbi:sigma-Y antisigma factor component [Mesobacillus foraminis]|uniref:sigma-Y antisigma factor component n=1 Tax=Mesobacillus foraminis TaxID=279826 RepID=UPI00399FDF3F
MRSDLNPEHTAFVIIGAAAVLLAQSIFLFMDSRKHGHNHWLWGILGLIQAPFPLLVYLIAFRKIWKRGKTFEH